MRGLDWVATVFLATILSGAAIPLDVGAQQLQANASLSPAVVPLNGQFTLEVELRGTNRVDAEPTLPDLGDFSRYIGGNSSTMKRSSAPIPDGSGPPPAPATAVDTVSVTGLVRSSWPPASTSTAPTTNVPSRIA